MSAKESSQPSALEQAMDWLLDDQIFAGFKQHGNAGWSFSALVRMALLWAWGGDATLRQRFQRGLNVLPRWFPRKAWGMTYQGFTKTLKKWSGRLLPVVKSRLRQRMREVVGSHWTVRGWTVVAVDGTRIETPRTKANEDWFARTASNKKSIPKKKSKQKRNQNPPAPQAWLTVMWHVGSGLLWDWRQGPNGSSERAHLLDMLDDLPPETLVTADAGFQGYEYWKTLSEKGFSFVIRVGGNVRLLKRLGSVRRRKNIVFLWPDRVRKRGEPPIVLRLIEFHDGRRSMWLVTNVLDRKQLSDKQTLEIYRLRWGIEVFFRGFKQTFGRGKLRSHAPRHVEMELDWSLVGLWSLELLAVRELSIRGQKPRDLSTAGAIRAVRDALHCESLGVDFLLFDRLAAIGDDGYARGKKSIRKWPRRKARSPASSPIIRDANIEEIIAACQLNIQAT